VEDSRDMKSMLLIRIIF